MAQWTLWDYNRVIQGEMAGWVAGAENEVFGFLVARRIGTDIEILNFAVHPDFRRSGIGGTLLQTALAWGAELHAERALLEVRASNFAALQFYERRGFEVAGRRPKYYTAPIEDALLLSAAIR